MEFSNSHRYIKTSEVIIEDDYPHEKVKCSICMNILLDPIQCSSCNKNLCRKCLYNLFRKKCPSCSNTEFSKVNDEILLTLEKLKLKCPHRCNKIITYKEYYPHSDKCENKIIICRNIGCNFQSKRKNMFEHLKSCHHRYMSCKYCDSPVKQFEYYAHESSCDMKKNLLIMNNNINDYVIHTKASQDELKVDQYYSSKFFNESSQINTVCRPDCKDDNNSLQINYDSNFDLSNAKNCKKCEDNKYQLTNRCSNCLKQVCRTCNPSHKEKLHFCKPFKDGCNILIELPKIYYTRPNAFFPVYKKFNFKEKINRNRSMCLVFFIFLAWLELLLFILDVFIIFLLFIFSGFGISLFFVVFLIIYFYRFCFKRKTLCKDNCVKFSYEELLNNYLLRVCKYGEIIGFVEGECWASNYTFNINKKCLLRDKKESNEFECIKSLFESPIFEKDKEVFINKEEHRMVDYDEENILFLERNGGGTLIARTYSKLLIGYYSNEEIIPNSQNFQNFYDTKNKLILLREVLKNQNL